MKPKPIDCMAYTRAQQRFCPRCNLVWDMDDPDPPDCLTDKQRAVSAGKEALREIQRTIQGEDYD